MLKKDITIGSDLRGLFSSGPFENLGEVLNWQVTYRDVDDDFDPSEVIEKDIDKIAKSADAITKRQFAHLELLEKYAKQKALAKQYDQIRWYPVSDTESYPSVTSVQNIISPVKWHVSKERLDALAARGTILDYVLQKYHEKKEWLQPKQIPECHPYLFKIDAFNKGLDDPTKAVKIEGDLPAFIEKYGIEIVHGHRKVISRTHKYGGEPDVGVRYENKLYLADLKSFYSSENSEAGIRALSQTAAYANAEEFWDDETQVWTPITEVYDGIMVIKIHGGNAQGWSKPTIKVDTESFFAIFLEQRKKFLEIFEV